ncbi:MAG: PCMD domain-containing protein [Bacteroidia bacterium]|nr:PCMD domain-containing protein [Bacteroidia bacterium]
MKIVSKGLVGLMVLFFFSCIKKEPLCPEADIEVFTFDAKYKVSETFIDQANRKIALYLTDEAFKKGLAPQITTSKGAKLSPASGDSIHFNKNIKYTVQSESGEYSKTYDVVVIHNISNYEFNFEKWAQNENDKYEFPLEDDGTQLWSSGNPGAAIAGVGKSPSFYPTRSVSDGYGGSKAAEMVTLKGTPITEIIGIKLIAGSIFYGNFNSQNALVDPPSATEFGQPFVGRALVFKGYYKYSPGPAFQDKSGNVIPNVSDSCSIYAVLFRGSNRLNGKNILSSDSIVAKAVLKDRSAKATFTYFEIPFEYTFNANLSGPLMLAIVASSSYKGDEYSGAVGSKLIVDQLTITRK